MGNRVSAPPPSSPSGFPSVGPLSSLSENQLSTEPGNDSNSHNGSCFLLRYLNNTPEASTAAAAAAIASSATTTTSEQEENDDITVVIELERLLRQLGLFDDFVQTLQRTSDSQETFHAFLEDFRTYYLLAEELNADNPASGRTPPASRETVDSLPQREVLPEEENVKECHICCEFYCREVKEEVAEFKAEVKEGVSEVQEDVKGEDVKENDSEGVKSEAEASAEASAAATQKKKNPCFTITQLPCGHEFHSKCIESWLYRKCTCPICRYELPTDDPYYERERKERMQSRQIVPVVDN